MHDEELELILCERAQRGDNDALDNLVRRMSDIVAKVAHDEDAESVALDGIVRAIQQYSASRGTLRRFAQYKARKEIQESRKKSYNHWIDAHDLPSGYFQLEDSDAQKPFVALIDLAHAKHAVQSLQRRLRGTRLAVLMDIVKNPDGTDKEGGERLGIAESRYRITKKSIREMMQGFLL